MAQPDFSEFTFGYGVTRYFEELFGARRVLPHFPTQNEEADDGYDVDFEAHGVPLFIQFKRSEVMTRRSSKECKIHPWDWHMPIYRMHLHGHNAFRQHYLMQALEAKGNMAVYITSQVGSKATLNEYYAQNRVIDAARMFLPSEIILPSTDERHHVAFNRGVLVHRVYSETGEPVVSRILETRDLLDLLRKQGDQTTESVRKSLVGFVDDLARLTPEGLADTQRGRRPVKSGRPGARIDEELSGRFQDYDWQDSELPEPITGPEFYERLRTIRSVARQAAIVAYQEADAHLIIVPRSSLG